MSIHSTSTHSLNGDEADTTTSLSTNNPKLDENAPRPRLCHLKKWPDFQGYGFNLHAERSKLGQHIGKVDAASPAESAGLREGDRIIEVNFVNISNENHQQVVKRIRNGLELNGEITNDQVVLLVLDADADDYYRKKNIVVKNSFDNVLRLETADRSALSSNPQVKDLNSSSTSSSSNTSKTDSNNNTNTIKSRHGETGLKDKDAKQVSNKDLNNNNETENEDRKVSVEALEHKLASISASSINNSSDTRSNHSVSSTHLNQSKLSNNSNSNVSPKSSPDQSQNSTLNRSINNDSSKDDIYRDLKSKTEVDTLQSCKRESSQEQKVTETIRSEKIRPPRPPPPEMNLFTKNLNLKPQTDKLDNLLEMSAAEFKNYLKSKGRNDPRVASVDMKRKHEIFQNM